LPSFGGVFLPLEILSRPSPVRSDEYYNIVASERINCDEKNVETGNTKKAVKYKVSNSSEL